MATKYCPHCGKSQPSALANFCFSCGEPLAGAKKVPAKASTQVTAAFQEDEGGTDVMTVPDIDKLLVEVDSGGSSEFAGFSAGNAFAINPDGTVGQRKFKPRRI